jgi:hypothetical protein
MNHLGHHIRHRFFSLFNPAVKTGWDALNSGRRNVDVPRVSIGLAFIGYGLLRGRRPRKLIYKTSIDAGQGTTIRVMRGRHPIAETAPLP